MSGGEGGGGNLRREVLKCKTARGCVNLIWGSRGAGSCLRVIGHELAIQSFCGSIRQRATGPIDVLLYWDLHDPRQKGDVIPDRHSVLERAHSCPNIGLCMVGELLFPALRPCLPAVVAAGKVRFALENVTMSPDMRFSDLSAPSPVPSPSVDCHRTRPYLPVCRVMLQGRRCGRGMRRTEGTCGAGTRSTTRSTTSITRG